MAKHFSTLTVDIGTENGWINYTKIPVEYGTDLVVLQCSHVSGAPRSKAYDGHQRSEPTNEQQAHTCRYQSEILHWYQSEYHIAQNSIWLRKADNRYLLSIDNQLLDEGRGEGLFLNMNKMAQRDSAGNYIIVKQYTTAKAFVASEDFVYRATESNLQDEQVILIGQYLYSDLFYFKLNKEGIPEKEQYRIQKLNVLMPQIITSPWPAQSLAQAIVQIEFEHNFRILAKENKYQSNNIIYIAGVHQHAMQTSKRTITPTLFFPWAAYIQQSNGSNVILEQLDLVAHLNQYAVGNPNEINQEAIMREMERHGY